MVLPASYELIDHFLDDNNEMKMFYVHLLCFDIEPINSDDVNMILI